MTQSPSVPALSISPADRFKILDVVHTTGRTSGKHRQRVGDAAFHSITVHYIDSEGRGSDHFMGYDPSSPTLARMNAERELHQWLTRTDSWQAFESCPVRL